MIIINDISIISNNKKLCYIYKIIFIIIFKLILNLFFTLNLIIYSYLFVIRNVFQHKISFVMGTGESWQCNALFRWHTKTSLKYSIAVFFLCSCAHLPALSQSYRRYNSEPISAQFVILIRLLLVEERNGNMLQEWLYCSWFWGNLN